jgi:glutathione S-transferase
MPAQPQLTLYHLNASRAVRVAWTLAALSLSYNAVCSERDPNTGVAPQELKDKIPSPHKKSPTLVDGDLVLQESGAIIEYLCETYDDAGLLMPKHGAKGEGWGERERCNIREWIAASEGTYLMHGISVRCSPTVTTRLC